MLKLLAIFVACGVLACSRHFTASAVADENPQPRVAIVVGEKLQDGFDRALREQTGTPDARLRALFPIFGTAELKIVKKSDARGLGDEFGLILSLSDPSIAVRGESIFRNYSQELGRQYLGLGVERVATLHVITREDRTHSIVRLPYTLDSHTGTRRNNVVRGQVLRPNTTAGQLTPKQRLLVTELGAAEALTQLNEQLENELHGRLLQDLNVAIRGDKLIAIVKLRNPSAAQISGQIMIAGQGAVGTSTFELSPNARDSQEIELSSTVANMNAARRRRFARAVQSRAIINLQLQFGDGAIANANGWIVSFTDHVAPILREHCVGCHGPNRREGGLRLDSFASIRQGGETPPLIVPGLPMQSLIYRRVLGSGTTRMPKDRPALPESEILKIKEWIRQGAVFDGSDESTDLNKLTRSANLDVLPVNIPRPDGDETVSFTRDIAPFIVNLCLRCHGGNNPRSGLSLETFEKMMQGGDSGEVILPGDRENSRLFRLVGGLENPRMPQGQARITRKNYEDLKTWFDEGNKFDGPDPKTPLRELVPTPAELAAERLAKMSPAEFAQHRLERSQAAWRRALSKETHQRVEAAETIVFGNVSEARLQLVSGWAEEHAKTLRRLFNETDEGRLWRGRLAVFVVKDRFGYEEFNIVNERREVVPKEMTGHSVVTAGMEEAYVVLQDIGDESTDDSPGLRTNLIDHMTGAFLKRSGHALPDWLARGTGLLLAAQADPSNAHFRKIRLEVPELLRTVARPEDIFANGTFSPAAVGPVGYTLVDYMWKEGGAPKFGQFIRAIEGGAAVPAALRSVYQTDMAALARSYLASIAGR